MSTIDALRQQFQFSHQVMEGTMADVTPEQANWLPPGVANPIGTTYAHAIVSEDELLQGFVRGAASLGAGEGVQTGLSAPQPPYQDQAAYANWFRTAQVDLAALRAHAQAVYANTDAYLASLSDADLERPLDLTGMGMGQQTVGFFLFNLMSTHVANLTGEISALKGVQGAKGYPF